MEANRNFANKIWNAGRFVISAINSLTPGSPLPAGEGTGVRKDWTLADSWIWARLQGLVREVERLFQSYQYGEAGRQIYEFFWSDFADWYVEVAKLQLAEDGERAASTARTLARVLDVSLRLLHPFTPFVTEELWGHLRMALRASPLKDLAQSWPEALIIAPWPDPRPEEGWEAGKLADFSLPQEVIRSIRNLRAEQNVKPGKRIPATIVAGGKAALLEEQARVIAVLAHLDESQLVILESLPVKPEGSIALVAGSAEIYLPLAGLADLDEERTRLQKELAEAQAQIERLEKLLGSDFATKAPAPVVQKECEKLAAYQETAEKLKAQLS